MLLFCSAHGTVNWMHAVGIWQEKLMDIFFNYFIALTEILTRNDEF